MQVTSNQFGYQAECATDMCIYSFKEVLNLYNRRKTPVFAAFIDIKSAFDRVYYWKLFNQLIDKKVPKIIVRFLVTWYQNQSICVSWEKYFSAAFYMNNGIKQGSILSPYLFNIFMDGLNKKLNSTKAGCCIGNNMVNNFSWADDMVVLSPNGPGLNELLKVSDNYASDNLITYNTKKIHVLQGQRLYHISTACDNIKW